MEDPTVVFNRFDVVSDTSDHYFAKRSYDDEKVKPVADKVSFSNSMSAVNKRIMKEWKTLEENLPESINVRVYETRIDLARAVIVGAAGTPYHDGLFFFDIIFPSDYPNRPPKINYRSFGLRINPNLYENGKVCLSLLNTWQGKNKTEKWDPYRSTLLQVLLSIQALVLNDKPFYNEPAFSGIGRAFFDGKSRVYNEHAFALTCRTSISLIRRPPKNFKDFIYSHFRERGHVILAACNEYVNGRMRVGYYGYEVIGPGPSSSSSSVKVHKEFKECMKLIYPDLVEALRSTGVVFNESCENQIVLTTSFEKLERNRKRSNKDKRHGIFKKVVAKIKQVLGWKNISRTKKD